MSSAERPRTPWRDNIEAMTVAVIMAVVLKYFIVEAYKIPTGSMQPTLMGNEETGIFDRILVDKLSYNLRDPERFEVVIFRYPLDRSKNFVKRIVGMPGEWFRIENGDLWTRPDEGSDWTVLRRPAGVQRDAWKPLVRDASGGRPWAVVEAEGEWRVEDDRIQARGSGRARFGAERRSVRDEYSDGYPEPMRLKVRRPANSARHDVGDLRLVGRVAALEGCERVVAELDEGPRRYTFTLPGPAAPEDAATTVEVRLLDSTPYGGPLEARGSPYRLPAGRSVDFSLENLDDRLTLRVAGEVVCSLDVETASDQRSTVWLAVEGEGADLDGLRVLRDIFYTTDGKVWQLEIPEDHYFMLGDNTQNSSDSRQWSWWNSTVDLPGAGPTELRGNFIQDQNPVPFYPEEGGSFFRFRDEWGEVRFFPFESRGAPSSIEAPLVSRDLITGRALLVFWPLAPRLGVYRLKWIH